MNLEESELFRKFVVSLRRGAISYQDKLGPFAGAGVAFVVGIAVWLVLHKFNIGGPTDWAAYLVSLVLIAISVFVSARLGRQNAILIEATLSYLIEGGRHFLDELLGKLISGQWRREQFKPGDALFAVLKEMAHGRDWQLKRRIAEALPALGEIDCRKALKIAEVLRSDWDAQWHADIRRRVVEALVIPSYSSAAPLLDRMKREQVRPFLLLRDRDQVFVGIAAAEAICRLTLKDKDFIDTLKKDLTDYAANHFSKEETDAVAAVFALFTVWKAKSVDDVAAMLTQMSESDNATVRIVAARNVLMIATRLPETTLNLMIKFLAKDQPPNVRRPIAKEQAVKFLASSVRSNAYREKAENLLVDLVTDSDAIIRVTAFDLIELLKSEKELYDRICDLVIKNEKSFPDASQDLFDRAVRAQSRSSRVEPSTA